MKRIRILMIVVLSCLTVTTFVLSTNAADRVEDQKFWDFNPFWWIWDEPEKWFSSILAAIQEPSLNDIARRDKTARVLRLINDEPFSSVIAYRIVVDPDGTAKLHTSATEIDNEMQPVGSASRLVSTLDQSKTAMLLHTFRKNKFWDEGTVSGRGAPDLICDDLSREFFHIEAVIDGKYKRVTQEICYDPPYRANVGRLLVQFSKIVGAPLPKLARSWK